MRWIPWISSCYKLFWLPTYFLLGAGNKAKVGILMEFNTIILESCWSWIHLHLQAAISSHGYCFGTTSILLFLHYSNFSSSDFSISFFPHMYQKKTKWSHWFLDPWHVVWFLWPNLSSRSSQCCPCRCQKVQKEIPQSYFHKKSLQVSLYYLVKLIV